MLTMELPGQLELWSMGKLSLLIVVTTSVGQGTNKRVTKSRQTVAHIVIPYVPCQVHLPKLHHP